MPLNPLDWTAGPFLTLYIALAAACVLAAAIARRNSAGSDTSSPGGTVSDPVELAWLSGGRRRAADTVLVAFLESGAAIQQRRGRLAIDPARLRFLGEFFRFARLTDAAVSVSSFRRLIQPGLDEVRDALASRGLAPSREQTLRLTRTTCMIFAMPLVLGLMKCMVGVERGRPIGFLITLLLFTGAVAFGLASRPPFRTRAGWEAVKKARQGQARAARAPEDSEMVLAFALSGAAVLAGRPYAPLLQSNGGTGCGGSGCSGGDGGGGGGGCGGCGGGGGGC